MADRSTRRILLIALAVIGAIALIVILGMWLMMAGMMSRGMGMINGEMMECCRGMAIAGWLLILLVIAGAVATFILVTSRSR